MDLQKISKYFTTKTLEEILQKIGGVELTGYQFGEKFGKGDSYLSDVYRLKVMGVDNSGKDIEINLIVKSMPKVQSRIKIFRSSTFFRNEINFYEKVIPKFEKFQESRNPQNPFVEYPRCLASYCDGENDYIALENINIQGYVSPNRQDYNNNENIMLVMRTLGRFHAVSLAFKNLDPNNFQEVTECVEETYYAESLRNWYGGFLKLALEVCKDAVKKTYPDSEYERKTEIFLSDKLYDDMIKLAGMRTHLSVIGHGDCWIPNFLSKYKQNSKIPEAVKIIDFQLARYGSPVLDIMFFVYNSSSDVQRIENYDKWIRAYHESACDLIKDLGGNPEKILPLSQLYDELKLVGRFGCGFALESIPLSMLEDDEIIDLDSVQNPNATLLDFWKISLIKDETKRKRLASVFKHAVDNKFL